MTLLTQISLKNRSLVALIGVCIVIFGLIAAGAVKQQLLPSFQPNVSIVSATYPGASPEAVENQVTIPLENALESVESVTKVESSSSSGTAQLTVTTEAGANSENITSTLNNAIASVSSQLPEGVDPQVFGSGLNDAPVAVVAATSDKPLDQLAQSLKDTAIPALEKLPGVESATLSGATAQFIAVDVKEKKLDDTGVSVDQIAQALQDGGVPVTAGTLDTDKGAAPVSVGDKISSVDDIRNTVLTGAEGPVKLKDVADISLSEEKSQSISRTNGKESLSIQVMKKPEANTVEVSHEVHDALDSVAATIGDNTEFSTVFDQAPYIEDSLEGLASEGLLGLGFAILVILVFLLSIRATLITALSIPLSLLLALTVFWQGHFTLNVLTLGALTISIGRVVDDSIVVIEAIRRRQHSGGSRFANILAAVGEVATAVTASTLVTVAVFLPLVFVTGQVGELFRPFAFTVTIALLSSLLVSLTIVPVLAYWFLKTRDKREKLTAKQKRAAKHHRKAALKEWKMQRKATRKQRVDVHNPSGRHATSEMPVVSEQQHGQTGGQHEEATEVDEPVCVRP